MSRTFDLGRFLPEGGRPRRRPLDGHVRERHDFDGEAWARTAVPAVPTFGLRGIIATPHHLASDAGLRVLRDGGSAVDAAIAANLVLSVTYPDMCGVGGDLFALVWREDARRPECLNASGPAGSGRSSEEWRRLHPDGLPTYGPDTVTVPGAPAGWAALHRRYGRVAWRRLFDDAIDYAVEGVSCPERLVRSLAHWEPDVPGLQFDGGRPAPGARLRQPAYGGTLVALASDGVEALTRGPAARELASFTDGALTSSDWERFEPEWVEPLGRRVLGVDWWTVPPNSQGYLALAAGAILEQLDPPRDPDDPRLWHLLVEATKVASRDRDVVLGDTGKPPEGFDGIAGRAVAIGERASAFGVPASIGDTVFLCAGDDSGLGVSLVQSLFHPFGSHAQLPQSGTIPQNRGSSFSLRPGDVNELRPGRRPRSTLSPTVFGESGRWRGLLGTMGGDVQPHVALQLLVKHHWCGLDPAEALAHPRFYVHRGIAPSIWSGDPPVVGIESRCDRRIVDDLQRRGHDVRVGGPFVELAGHAQLAVRHRSGYAGAADPRSGAGSAAAW